MLNILSLNFVQLLLSKQSKDIDKFCVLLGCVVGSEGRLILFGIEKTL